MADVLTSSIVNVNTMMGMRQIKKEEDFTVLLGWSIVKLMYVD